VLALFREYLDDVRGDDQFIRGKNPAGRFFVFKQKARWAYLVLGAPNPESARLLIREAEKTSPSEIPGVGP
jgi:hypothetical protein